MPRCCSSSIQSEVAERRPSPRLHRPGAGGQRAAVEQELLGEGGLAGVGVRDDRERAAPGRLRRHPGGVGSGRVHDRPSVPAVRRAHWSGTGRSRNVLATGSTPERLGTADRTSSVLSPSGRPGSSHHTRGTASPMSSPITRSLAPVAHAHRYRRLGLPLLAGPRSSPRAAARRRPDTAGRLRLPRTRPHLEDHPGHHLPGRWPGLVDRHLRRLPRRVLAPPRGPGPHGAEAHPAGGLLRRHSRRPQPRVRRQQHLHRGRRRLVLRVPPHQQRHALHRRRRQPHRVGVRGRHDGREPGGPGSAHRLRRRQRQRRVHRIALPLRDPQAVGLRGLELAGRQREVQPRRRPAAATAGRARDLRAVGQLARPHRPAVHATSSAGPPTRAR